MSRPSYSLNKSEQEYKSPPEQDFSLSEALVPFETASYIENLLLNKASLPIPMPSCFIWSMPQGIVVPKSISSKPSFKKACETMASLNWPVHVRQTGGDLTPQAPGMINISYIFSEVWHEKTSIEAAYKKLCDPITEYLNKTYDINAYTSSVEGAFCDGKFNIVVDGLKIAGTAQKWRRFKNQNKEDCLAVLGHVALLADVPIHQLIAASNSFYKLCDIEKTIKPENHTNLSELIPPQKFNRTDLMKGLLNSFHEHTQS
jgi:lipoate-protein ligase A